MSGQRLTGDSLARIIEARTGHTFSDISLLTTALTHSSAVGAERNNERLEFLGDRVLALVIAEMLVSAFPDAREGELAVRLNALVRGETCAEVAREIKLDELLRTDSAFRARGTKAKNILSDATEALIAAIYLDGGLEKARAFILRYWQGRSSADSVRRDAKTELQEWAVREAGGRPAYAILRREGPDHAPVFTVSVEIEGRTGATGSGRSRREAEQAAATTVLIREGVWTEGTNP